MVIFDTGQDPSNIRKPPGATGGDRQKCPRRSGCESVGSSGLPASTGHSTLISPFSTGGQAMQPFEFEVILSGVDEMTEDISNALYEAGCDDGTPFSSEGVAAVGFTREAASLEDAIRSAIADVQKAGYSVARVESADQPVLLRINAELAKN
jgi:hypothetical protein